MFDLALSVFGKFPLWMRGPFTTLSHCSSSAAFAEHPEEALDFIREGVARAALMPAQSTEIARDLGQAIIAAFNKEVNAEFPDTDEPKKATACTANSFVRSSKRVCCRSQLGMRSNR